MAATPRVPDGADTCQHRLRVVGYLRGPRAFRALSQRSLRPRDLPGVQGCEAPLLAACEDCDEVRVWLCSNHRESRCKPCASRYRRRVFRVADEGMLRALYLHQGARRFAYLWTLSAPSTGPHQRFIPGRRGRHGWCSCEITDLATWNARQGSAWNRLRTSLRDQIPEAAYFRAVEVQDGKRGGTGRGALHLHVLLVVDQVLNVDQLHALALAAGFGCVMDLELLPAGSTKAARYVSKYVSKACDSRTDVPWAAVTDDGEPLRTDPFRATYRTWSQSRNWPCRMAEVVDASRLAVNRSQAAMPPSPVRAGAPNDATASPEQDPPPV